MYSNSKGDETVERVYAFTDEYGAFGWDIDNPSVSTHFIITAVIVKESDLSVFTQKTDELRRKHFQTGEIKSSKVGKNMIGVCKFCQTYKIFRLAFFRSASIRKNVWRI